MNIAPLRSAPHRPASEDPYLVTATGVRRDSATDELYLSELKSRMGAHFGDPHIGGAHGRVQHLNFGVSQLPQSAEAARAAKKRRAIGICLGLTALATVIGVSVGLSIGLTRKHVIALDPHQLSGPFHRSFQGANLSVWDIFDETTNGGSFRCGFSKSSVHVDGETLALSVTDKRTADMPASCAQLVYKQPVSYGQFQARLQPAAAPGIVTAIFLYNMTSPNVNQEVDIEFTGQNTSLLHTTSFRDAKVTTNLVPLGFDAAKQPHTYMFDWQPNYIAWSVDGSEVYRQTASLPNYAQQRLFISTWLRVSSDWGGLYDEAGPVPTDTTSVEWVSYTPSA